ncbi:MAG: hypothetical protein R3C69_09845 [Geminicoccaceae bacterium]
MKKEELILFSGHAPQAAARLATPIGEMRHDHDSHGRFLEEMARLTDDASRPRAPAVPAGPTPALRSFAPT